VPEVFLLEPLFLKVAHEDDIEAACQTKQHGCMFYVSVYPIRTAPSYVL
jgi:hypothetical protein